MLNKDNQKITSKIIINRNPRKKYIRDFKLAIN